MGRDGTWWVWFDTRLRKFVWVSSTCCRDVFLRERALNASCSRNLLQPEWILVLAPLNLPSLTPSPSHHPPPPHTHKKRLLIKRNVVQLQDISKLYEYMRRDFLVNIPWKCSAATEELNGRSDRCDSQLPYFHLKRTTKHDERPYNIKEKERFKLRGYSNSENNAVMHRSTR